MTREKARGESQRREIIGKREKNRGEKDLLIGCWLTKKKKEENNQ
jgi:hypothetical protein